MRRRGFRFMDDDTAYESPDTVYLSQRCACGALVPWDHDAIYQRARCAACLAKDEAEESAEVET